MAASGDAGPSASAYTALVRPSAPTLFGPRPASRARDPRRRVRLGALLLHLAFVGALAPGRPAGADPATAQNLLGRGHERLQEAERAWQQGRAEHARQLGLEAERLFQDALEQAPDHLPALMLAGQAAAFTGDVPRALAWAERYARRTAYGAKDPDLLYLRAFIAVVAQGDPETALAHLERMLAVNPRVRPMDRDLLAYGALLELGRRELKAKRNDLAVRHFQAAARVARRLGHPRKEVAALGNTAVALRRGDRFDEAAAILAQLKQSEPENPVWWWEMGLTYADQNRFDEAMPEYLRVLDLRAAGKTVAALDEELRMAWLRLGNCLRHVGGRPDNLARRAEFLARARDAFESFMREAPESSLGPKWMGVLLLQDLNAPHEAEPYFRRAYALDPTCDDALRYLIQIHEHHPPPPPDPPTDDPAVRAQIEASWRAPVAQWKAELEAQAQGRKRERDRREAETGTDGCM